MQTAFGLMVGRKQILAFHKFWAPQSQGIAAKFHGSEIC